MSLSVCVCVRECLSMSVCVVEFSGSHCVDTQKLRNQQEMHETKMDDH